jgi:hypothetical protein
MKSSVPQPVAPESSLPPVSRALLGFAAALLLGAYAAVQAVSLVGSHVGTLAAVPLGLLTFIVVSAVALVLAARLDAAFLSR